MILFNWAEQVYPREFEARISRQDRWEWTVRILGRATTEKGSADWRIEGGTVLPTEWLARWWARRELRAHRRRNAELLSYKQQNYVLNEDGS